jgi:stalled ribosome rescue protein Dom34
MKNTNQLGIWMDDSAAFLMEFTTNPLEVKTILCEFPIDDKNGNNLKKTESTPSTKKSVLNKYYNKIGRAIIKYDEIILFGPSDAKIDFFDFLSEDERFLKLKIEIKNADKMDVNQQHAFIKDYFGQD